MARATRTVTRSFLTQGDWRTAMLGLLIAAVSVVNPASDDASLALCKPVLARKAGGEIANIDVTSSRAERNGRRISGRLTAFLGMGPPAPGSASAHHLIRADFTFHCRVAGGRVREAAVNPLGR
jgi:hypothetical protein